ncbi:hypothetical protein [Azospirillum argentinense]|uniref:hypothetical protein n=1 Tax=Azospirillum argentinense TaxID=2970906 RepID=UPI0032DE2FED
MGMRARGVEGLGITLRQVGERAVRSARERMKREGETVAELARQYAPVDHEGPTRGSPPGRELERSIRAEKVIETNRRLAIAISAGGTVGGVDVDAYAALMHEGLAPYGSGAYQPGPLTRAKGGKAGGKYLERAFTDRQDRIIDAVVQAIKRGL